MAGYRPLMAAIWVRLPYGVLALRVSNTHSAKRLVVGGSECETTITRRAIQVR